MGSLQLVLCVFLGWFFFGFHRSLRGNGGAFCAEYLVIHVVNVNFTHSLTYEGVYCLDQVLMFVTF